MAVERRTLLLGGTLAVALVAWLVRSVTTDRTTSAAVNRPQPSRPAPAANAQPVALDATKVNLTALERKRLGPQIRDAIHFASNRRRPRHAPPSERRRPTPVTQMPMVPAGPPPPPPIPLKFIGLVEKTDGTKIAVLSDGRRPHSGVEGQEIDGRYRILKIGTESIEMAYLDGRGRQTIRLTGQ